MSLFDPRAGGLGTHQSIFSINALITCNICDHGGIYKNIGLHMFDLILARGWQAIHSLLHASATMAMVEVELHPAVTGAIGFVAFVQILSSSVCVCVVGWKRGWCYTEGERSDATGAHVI